MRWLRGHVKDDSGRPVTLYRSYDGRDEHRAQLPKSGRSVSRSEQRYKHLHLVAAGGILVFMGGGALVLMLVLPGMFSWGSVPLAIFFGVSGLGSAVLVTVVANKARATQTRLASVRDHICPACGYSLDNLPTRDDGRTACPECGAVWTLQSEKNTQEKNTQEKNA